ncbi:MAG: tRNA (N6-threonylcarbamoyladenosine(37)-N6)-methyltransferase TrmO, partial [Peptococcaceae bacterium]|nr:tRNA (N6-threonylcarbamoyladenosine(37)-N6)-methyltransferase TrmO [Peptococcaceae bacterium]
MSMPIHFQPVGTIHTPYTALNTPLHPPAQAEGEFWITLNAAYAAGLDRLAEFRYIYVLFYADKVAVQDI